QRIRPLPRFNAMVKIFSFSTAGRKILSPAMAGEEWPGGRVVFQTTLRSGPNSVGRMGSSETPDASGPRNCGQSDAMSSVAIRTERIKARLCDRMCSLLPHRRMKYAGPFRSALVNALLDLTPPRPGQA